jgi:hypothetical protein
MLISPLILVFALPEQQGTGGQKSACLQVDASLTNRAMKTNRVFRLKNNALGGEKCIEPKSNLTILLLLFVALALAGCEGMESGSPAAYSPWSAAPTGGSTSPASQTGFASGLSGRWYHDDRPTSIDVAPDGRSVTVIDEVGRRTDGYVTSPGEFLIPRDNLRGRLSHDGRRISWTNGGEWTREPHKGGSDRGQAPGQGSSVSGRYDGGSDVGQAPSQRQDISGRWYHDGKPTSISVSGQTVTITNEVGQSSSGSMSGNEIVISGGIRGHVGPRGQRISWSNGTEWRR